MTIKDSSDITHSSLSDVQTALANLGALHGPSETHAIMSGYLCGRRQEPLSTWLKVLLETIDAHDQDSTSLIVLNQLYTTSKAQLEDDNFIFELIMPADNEPLAVRVAALSKWSDGFMLGLGLAGTNLSMHVNDDVKEALLDLKEIAKLDLAIEDNEEDEQAFYELYEYTRLAVILIYQELAQKQAIH